MNFSQANQASANSAVAASIEDGWQMPARLYADPRVHAVEQSAIFKKAWICVGRESLIANTGDYITAQLGDLPVLVVRDAAGRLRGHVNACRHRLHPVALRDSGCKHVFQCSYHGWTYSHEGALRAAPGVEGCPAFDKGELGLIPVRVDTFRGFVFANADPNAEDLPTYLGNAEALAQELGIDFAQWDHAGTFSYDIDADWKLFTENSLECYHCPLVHADTFAAYVGTQPRDYITREFRNVLTHCAPITRAPGAADATTFDGFRLIYIWPATFLSVDDFVGIVARITPTGPQRTRFTVDTFVRPDTDAGSVEEWLQVYDLTFQEDKKIVAAQQAGYLSGGISQGRLMVNREASIQMFQRRTWEALRGDLDAPVPPAFCPEPARSKQPWEGELDIVGFEQGAEGVAVITLAARDGGGLPDWQPGAHVDLILPSGLERQYSLCGDPRNTGQWRIGVLREPHSRGGSAFVHEQLRALGKVRVRGPRNHFPLPDAPSYRFVAGGIGITPILPMILEAERRGKDWRLLYGGRSLASMAFVDELRAYGGRVMIAPHDTHGLLDLDGFLRDAAHGAAVCACGPEPLLQALATVCAALPATSLHLERFAPVPRHQTEDSTAFDLELRKSGRTVRVGAEQTVLDAIRGAGVPLLTSCENGVCGTCETVVLDGIPDHRDAVLTARERASGKTMMVCVSRCKTNKLVLDL